jgi:hypothetical protein
VNEPRPGPEGVRPGRAFPTIEPDDDPAEVVEPGVGADDERLYESLFGPAA